MNELWDESLILAFHPCEVYLHGLFDGRVYIVLHHILTEENLHRESSAGNGISWHVAKEVGKLISIHCCWCYNQLQIMTSGHNLIDRISFYSIFNVNHSVYMLIRNSIESTCTWICSYIPKESKQDICIEWAFVSFVHYDSTVVIQVRLSQRFSQQNTICHVLNDSFL